MAASATGCQGFCQACGKEHSLPRGASLTAAGLLMEQLAEQERIDFDVPLQLADSRLATSFLFGPAKGKMFGVMEALTPQGTKIFLRAFSGQYNGAWQVPGWVGPLFDLHAFHRVHDREESRIKELGRQMEGMRADTSAHMILTARRKKMSQNLMRRLHGLYRVYNFSGQVSCLAGVFPEGMGIPTGTGDCCAPKLLQYAAVNNIRPLSLTEFYWGKATASGSRQHGVVYPSCQAKCYPLLGFMLCGLEA